MWWGSSIETSEKSLPVIYVMLSEHLPDALREPGRRTMTMGGRPVTSPKWPKYTSQVHYIPNRSTTWLDICYMLRIIWPVRTDVVKSHLRQRLHLYTPDLRPPAGECDWGINCLYDKQGVLKTYSNLDPYLIIYIFKETVHCLENAI